MIQVAAVILTDENGRILICKRAQGASCAHLWEMPGGKLEPGETPEQAAVRECQEELGVQVVLGGVYAKTEYSYPDKTIEFTFFNGRIVSGEPEMRVHEEMAWVLPSQLKEYEFCPADVGLVQKLAADRQMERVQMPHTAAQLLRILHENGHEAWAVGGCVRDSLLGKNPTDWDLCTSAKPEEVKACFSGVYRVLDTGLKHGTVTVLADKETYEITTFRQELDYADHRRPQQVQFVSSVEEDLARRDFTINAMTMDVDGTIVDPFGGQQDLQDGILRCVGEPEKRFEEDGLRILRLVRFAATLGFSVEESTKKAAMEKRHILRWVAAERSIKELNAMLCGGYAAPVVAEYGLVLACLMPQIEPALTHPYSEDKTLWEHAADTLSDAEQNPLVRWAMLLRDVGKPYCGEGYRGHAEVSAQLAQEILHGLKLDKAGRNTICQLIRFHGVRPARDAVNVRRWMQLLGPEQLEYLVQIWRADAKVRGDSEEGLQAFCKELERCKEQDCWTVNQLAVTGGNLLTEGLAQPGPSTSRLLEWLLHEVVEGRVENTRQALLEQARKWSE